MKSIFLKISVFIFSFAFIQNASAQNPENWTARELMEPSILAQAVQSGKDVPLIYSVGPGNNIPNSIAIGMGNDEKNINKFKNQLASLPKDQKLVIYCGCCPFDHCPNVRPAITALKEAKFTNYYLLNIPQNLKKDWIDKGYPTDKK